MNHYQVNPFLPSFEYIPDGEPKVFGNRVYLYGSHDRFNGFTFCMNDYVCWSAPIDNLSMWTYEGVIYRRSQHPKRSINPYDRLFAPDVCQGPDGRYYLYYGFSFYGILSVAVSDLPKGPFTYLNDIHYQDGTKLGTKKDPMGFDPGVLVDHDGRVYLYYGFGAEHFPILPLYRQHPSLEGAWMVELAPDMVTVLSSPQPIGVPSATKATGTPFAAHPFFEASSIRHYDETYYFIYSSCHGHELCYATSVTPHGPFKYEGVLVSNGDIGLDTFTDVSHAANFTGNNHGSLLQLGDQMYIFYHRHTNKHSFSRQASAERLQRDQHGRIIQSRMTSNGLSENDLPGQGTYEARIACHLSGPKGTRFYGVCRIGYSDEPYLTQTGKDRENLGTQYICNIRSGAMIGYRYFDLTKTTKVWVSMSGSCEGYMDIRWQLHGDIVASIAIKCHSHKIHLFFTDIPRGCPHSELFFTYRGTGHLNLHRFHLV